MNTEKLINFTLVILVVSISSSLWAEQVVLYNTFGPDDYFSTKDSNSGFSADVGLNPYSLEQQKVANGFSIATNLSSIYLDSIEVAISNSLNNDGGNVITMTLHEGSNGIPGTAIENFDIILAPKYSHQIYSLSSSLNPELYAGQEYWLVASSPDPESELGWLWNGLESWGTYTGSELTYSSSTDSWTDKSQYGQQAFRISASATVVPLPGAAYLFILSISALAGKRILSIKYA